MAHPEYKWGLARIIFCIILWCTPQIITAQQIDGTKNKYDTNEIKKNINEDWALIKDHPDSAIILYKRTLAQSEEANFPTGIIGSLRSIMNIYISSGNYGPLLSILQQALTVCIKSGKSNKALPYIYNSIAGVYARQSNYDEASKSYYQ